MPYRHTIIGAVEDGFTSAEIEDEAGAYMGRVFELNDGWYIHVQEIDRIRDQDLVDAIVAAKAELIHYMNRKGADFSSGEWTRFGVSLFLMQRDDDTGFTIKAGD